MWQKILTLTLLLASMASGSDSGNGSVSTTCPKICLCRRIIDDEPVEIIIDESTEVYCRGRLPPIGSLPRNSRRFIVEEIEPQDIINMLVDFDIGFRNETGVFRLGPAIRELAIINCSLTRVNVTLGGVSKNLFATRLNLSRNEFNETEAIEIREGRNLERLDLSSNLLTRVRRQAFVGLPGLVELSLRRNAIRVIEDEAFVGLTCLENLDLSDNRLATLPEDAFVSLSLLQKLDLSDNKLSVLGGRWFDSLGRLRELDVSRNGLSRQNNNNNNNNDSDSDNNATNSREDEEKRRIEEGDGSSGILQGLPLGLTELRLADNPLRDVAELSLVLGSCRRLETVDASQIGLVRVPSALTRSVRRLTLAGNRLRTIRSGDFDSYPLLRLLDLSNNLLKVIEEDALGRLEILEKLDLSGNRLIEIPQSLPSYLVRLVLRENLIERLNAKDLQGLVNLRYLFLNKNAITEIEEGSMKESGLLTELDISDNPIKQLPANTFDGPTRLVELRMSGLGSLQWEREKRADMAFPVPAPERLVSLDLSRSPALAAQLLADDAALSACKSLTRLNLARTNLTTLRSDLAFILPQLWTLGLSENDWNCSSANSEILWLAEWINEHEEMQPPARCSISTSSGINDNNSVLLSELATLTFEPLTTVITTTEIDDHLLDHEKEQSISSTFGTLINPASDSDIKDKDPRTIVDSSLVTKSLQNFPKSDATTARSNEIPQILRSIVSRAQTNDKEDFEKTVSIATKKYRDETHDREIKSEDLMELEKKMTPMENSVAEELTGSEESVDSESRISEVALSIGAHPGMLVLACAALGAAAVFSVLLSRRITSSTEETVNSSSCRENIEVRTLVHQQPIVTDLW